MRRNMWLVVLTVLGTAALVVAGVAGGAAAKKGKPSQSATPVFKLLLKPSQEVPPVKNLRAAAVGSVTFDLERSLAGAITSGEVIFYFNYAFPGSVTITGLHIHKAPKGSVAPPLVSSGVASFTDSDGSGNVTTVVTGVAPATLQDILANPRGYYVNLHTSVNPDGALRAQMHNPKKR